MFEYTKEQWAKNFADFLRNAKKLKEEANGFLDTNLLIQLEKIFQGILKKAIVLHPNEEKKTNKKGRKKQTPTRNLVERIEKYQDAVLAFLYHPDIPFDNNQAERDIRPIKLRRKISGSFRSEYGAPNYLRVASIFLTLTKQKKSIFQELGNFLETGKMNIIPQID